MIRLAGLREISIRREEPESRAASNLGLIAAAAALLLWPAIYNGFPLIFPDTGAYLAVAWGNYWTIDRSGFYGFFLRPLSSLDPYAQLWVAVFLQGAAAGAAIVLALRRMAPRAGWAALLLIIAALAALTSLPWHSAQLMPDAFSGICVLAVWLACLRNPSENGAPALWFAAYLTGLMHYTHVLLVLAAGAGALVAQLLFRGPSVPAIARRALTCGAVALAILATQTVANGAFLQRWSAAPMGSAFLFARVHEDGLVQPWLEEHCPRGETPSLCRAEPGFPRDVEALLWGKGSPLRPLLIRSRDGRTNEAFVAELRTAVLGAIWARPLEFGESALRAGLDQFMSFRVLDDECPEVCRNPSSAVSGWFHDYRPELMPSFLASRQLSGTTHKDTLRAITTPVAGLALLLMPILAFAAWRRRDALAFGLISAVLLALIANAIATGGLSDVHDRYQSRLVWVAVLTVLATLLRWRTSAAVEET